MILKQSSAVHIQALVSVDIIPPGFCWFTSAFSYKFSSSSGWTVGQFPNCKKLQTLGEIAHYVYSTLSSKTNNMITWDDFEKVEMRVGTVLEVKDFPEAKNPSYQVKIDFGKFGIKKTSAQITKLYKKEDLIGKQIIAVTNFPPKQVANIMSECLILGVVLEDKKYVVLQPERSVENGLQIA
jgi:tRNA-binding protein